MASLISSGEKATLSGVFEDIFDTFFGGSRQSSRSQTGIEGED